jgi:hypothetical protein
VQKRKQKRKTVETWTQMNMGSEEDGGIDRSSCVVCSVYTKHTHTYDTLKLNVIVLIKSKVFLCFYKNSD